MIFIVVLCATKVSLFNWMFFDCILICLLGYLRPLSLSPFIQFSLLSSWTAGRPVGCFARHGRNSYGLSKAEFMEKVQQSSEACQRGDFQTAVELYTEALQADPQSCILYSNRAAALFKLGRHREALDDASQACELNPKWPKVSLLPLNVNRQRVQRCLALLWWIWDWIHLEDYTGVVLRV